MYVYVTYIYIYTYVYLCVYNIIVILKWPSCVHSEGPSLMRSGASPAASDDNFV